MNSRRDPGKVPDRYNQRMHLSDARLCLDCQEIHDLDRCPSCTSDSFGFMTRWVKLDATPRPPAHEKPVRTSKVDTYRRILNPQPSRSKSARWLRKASMVVATGYLARWGWNIASQHARPSRPQAAPKDNAQASSH